MAVAIQLLAAAAPGTFRPPSHNARSHALAAVAQSVIARVHASEDLGEGDMQSSEDHHTVSALRWA